MSVWSKGQMPGFSQRDLRLFQAQQILAENMNVPLRILRGDCLERLEHLLESEPWNLVSDFVNREEPTDLISEPLPDKLVAILSPRAEDRFAQVSMALWATPASAPHPFYEEIKLLLPHFQARVRINLLRRIRRLSSMPEEAKRQVTLNLPTGLVGALVPLEIPVAPMQRPDVVVVGPSRLLSAERHRSSNRFVALEQETRTLIDSLGPQFRNPLNVEDKTHLLVLNNAYFSYLDSDLLLKAEAARRAMNRVNEIERRYPDDLDTFSSAEWNRLVQFLFFWQSSRTLPLLQRFIVSELGEQQTGFWKRRAHAVGFSVSARLSSKSASPRPLTSVRMCGSSNTQGELTLDDLAFELDETEETLGTEELHFELEDGRQVSEQAQRQLTYFYHRALEDGHANRAWQEYLSFDRLRHDLQHLRVAEMTDRSRLFTERARGLLMADIAAYLEFDALQDLLTVASVKAAPWIGRNDVNRLNHWLAQVATDSRLRQESAIYRCLDSKCYQSKLLITEDSQPFATRLDRSLRQAPIDEEVWGFEAKDAIAVPVQLHDRILGVLYIASSTADRFRYYDRIRLLRFVRMFEGELFEAKLFTVLQGMNGDLGEALREKLTQNQFCDRLMMHLGRLLNVAGAVLWWRSPTAGDSLEVLGLAGRKLSGCVSHGQRERRTSFPSGKRSRGAFKLQAPVKNTDLPFTQRSTWPLTHALAIFLLDLEQRKVLGIITLHDSAVIKVSQFLADELQFVRDEIGQNLASYLEQRQRILTIRDLIGHDLGSALKYIDSTRRRLTAFLDNLPGDRKVPYRMRLGDLDRTVRRAQQLLDLLTRESLRWQLLKGEVADYSVPYRILSRALEKKLSIHEAINTALHAKDLLDRGIKFEVTGRHPPLVWLDEGALGRILANMADNVVKYGKSPQQIEVSYDEDELEFFVHIDSLGFPLRQELRASPEEVFRQGVRGVEEAVQKKTRGKGQGLYTAREMARIWEGQLDLDYDHGEPWARYRFTLTFPRWLASSDNPWRQR